MKTNSKTANILLVEDDPNLSMVIQDYLEMLDYKTMHCKDGEEGLTEFKKNEYNLVILDVMMPKMDGFMLAEEIRKRDDNVPIIFLTAKSLKEDRIKGFQVGCDDYISKPFSTEELSMRIKAILKRCATGKPASSVKKGKVHSIGEYQFDEINMVLSINNNETTLTRKESALLKLLCVYRDKLLTRETALKMIWGDDDYFIGRSMDVFISKLRKLFKEDPRIHIRNVHGMGFKLEVVEELEELQS